MKPHHEVWQQSVYKFCLLNDLMKNMVEGNKNLNNESTNETFVDKFRTLKLSQRQCFLENNNGHNNRLLVLLDMVLMLIDYGKWDEYDDATIQPQEKTDLLIICSQIFLLINALITDNELNKLETTKYKLNIYIKWNALLGRHINSINSSIYKLQELIIDYYNKITRGGNP